MLLPQVAISTAKHATTFFLAKIVRVRSPSRMPRCPSHPMIVMQEGNNAISPISRDQKQAQTSTSTSTSTRPPKLPNCPPSFHILGEANTCTHFHTSTHVLTSEDHSFIFLPAPHHPSLLPSSFKQVSCVNNQAQASKQQAYQSFKHPPPPHFSLPQAPTLKTDIPRENIQNPSHKHDHQPQPKYNTILYNLAGVTLSDSTTFDCKCSPQALVPRPPPANDISSLSHP